MLRVTIITPDGAGYDVSAEAEGLQYSNVRPGGDEQATFLLRRSWLETNPEVRKGSRVTIADGLDVLWQGELDEDGRGSDATEIVEVTCYGTGALLKDDLFRMIFVDRDFAAWREMSQNRHSTLLGGFAVHKGELGVEPDGAGLPVLSLTIRGQGAITIFAEAWYDIGDDLTVAAIEYAHDADNTTGSYEGKVGVCETDQAGATEETTADLLTVGNDTGEGTFTPSAAYRYGLIRFTMASAPDGEHVWRFPRLAVFGPHGLTPSGSPAGFTADQIVGWIADQVGGIATRVLDPQGFEIPHFVIDAPTSHEDGIAGANAYAGAAWGTWGPESVLDRTGLGYLDYRTPPEDADWIIRRADCDEIDLRDELGSLYNRLLISWQDSSGEQHIEERTAVVPALEDAGRTRTLELDIGQGSQGAAQQTGDVYFALQGTDPPARGSATISAPIEHRERGELPPHYLRADGSNVKVVDVLPYGEAIALGRIDRRTVFPIQRVNVNAAEGPVPVVSVDLDQASDRLSVLQAQLEVGVAHGSARGGGSTAGWGTQVVTGAKTKRVKVRRRRPGMKGGLVAG